MNPAGIAVAIGIISLGLTGCSSSAATGTPTSQARSAATTGSPSASHPSVGTTAPETKTVTKTASQPTTTTTTATVATSTTAAAPPANCGNAQLSVRRADAEGGDSNGGIVVIFTNISTQPCSLRGYPGAALVDETGKQFVQARRDLGGMIASCNCSHPLRIRLTRGTSASATLEGNNGGGDECLRGRTALVTAPNTTRAVSVRYQGSYSCDVQIHPVVAGTEGGNRH